MTAFIVGALVLLIGLGLLGYAYWRFVFRRNATPPTTPTTRQPMDWQKVLRIVWALVGVFVLISFVIAVIGGIREMAGPKTTPETNTAPITTQVQTNEEEWVFSQVNLNGEKPTFEVEITKSENDLLNLVIQRRKGGTKENLAGLRLIKNGDDLKGTWVDYLNQDQGEVYMQKVADNTWSGHYTQQDKTTRLCTLKRK